MKSFLTIIFFVLGFVGLYGQDKGIYERSFEFDKRVAAQANGLVYKANAPKAFLEAAIEKKFDEVKSKSKNMRKDLVVFESTVLGDVSMQTMDYYFRLKELSPNQTEIQMFISLGNDNFITGEKYQKEVAAAGLFLQNLDKSARMARLEKRIATQQALIQAEKEKQEALLKESKSLIEEKAKLQKALEENALKQDQLDQAQQKAEAQLELETQKLSEMTEQMLKIKNQ